MTNWMRRRIERSRARCDKTAESQKPDRQRDVTKEATPLVASAPPQQGSS